MGLNRQPRRPVVNSRFNTMRRAYRQNRNDKGAGKEQGATNTFLRPEAREMLIEVLQHVASGGLTSVADSHFSSARSVITLKRNRAFNLYEATQLIGEKLGFPPDIVAEYIMTNLSSGSDEKGSSTPSREFFMTMAAANLQVATVNSLLLPDFTAAGLESEELEKRLSFGSLFYKASWDMFSMMVIGEEEGQPQSASADAELEEGAVDEEIEQIQMIFGDQFIEEKTIEGSSATSDGDCEAESYQQLVYRFESIDGVPLYIAIQLGNNYPSEPPIIVLDNQLATFTDERNIITAASFAVSAQARRAIMDASISIIKIYRGQLCLLPLLGELQGVISGQSLLTEAKPAAHVDANASSSSKRTDGKAAAAKARFIASLLDAGLPSAHAQEADGKPEAKGNARYDAYHNRNNSNNKKPLVVDSSSKSKTANESFKSKKNDSREGKPAEEGEAPEYVLPGKLEMKAGDALELAAGRDGHRHKARPLKRDAETDKILKQQWERLQSSGSLAAIRRQLPAFQQREQLREAVSKSNVVVVSGETGSGKTTQVPQFLYEFMCEEGNGSLCRLLCTQPRRLAATAVAIRVAEERDEDIGQSVGYSIRLENKMSSQTRLLYCTTGIVLRRLQTDKLLDGVSHVVVDEIHERGVDTDFLLILLRDLLEVRKDLKVILMSATMDSALFARYFGGAPVINIAGRTHPVEVVPLERVIPLVGYIIEDGSPYALDSREMLRRSKEKRNTSKHLTEIQSGLQDAADEAEDDAKVDEFRAIAPDSRTARVLAKMNLEAINYELVEAIVYYIVTQLRHIDGAILIFMPGLAEINRCVDELRYSTRLSNSCLFYNLHSSLGSSEQRSVFQRAPKGKRKVIVGTNIMETSITIDDAVFVIDSGKVKENRYDPRKCLSQLVMMWVAKANARQRSGRAGRVRPGFCYRLYTSPQFDRLQDHQLCEMHRVPLESLILQIYTLNLGDEMAFLRKALTPPEQRAVEASVKVLTGMGALTYDKRLTALGAHLANLPIDVRIGKMVIHGALLGCLDPVLTIAAALAVRSPFDTSEREQMALVQRIQKTLSGDFLSDQLAVWNAYRVWVAKSQSSSRAEVAEHCRKYHLIPQVLQQIQLTKRQYEWFLYEAGFLDAGCAELGPNGAIPKNRNSNFVFPLFVRSQDEDIVYEAGGRALNSQSREMKCVLACLVAGLYPNIAKMLPSKTKQAGYNAQQRGGGGGGDLKLATLDGSKVVLHPSSVLAGEKTFAYPLICYLDKVKTSQIFLREVSVVSPLMVILFGSTELSYLEEYSELVVDKLLCFRCGTEEAVLLRHIREQFETALTTKINDPKTSWESISATVVRAIMKLLKDEGTIARSMIVIDHSERAALTAPLRSPDEKGSDAKYPGPAPAPEKPEAQPFKTNKMCFNCGQVGHVTRYCPNPPPPRHPGSPSTRCFICGQWHHPANCPFCRGALPSTKA